MFPEAVPGARFFCESQVNRIGSTCRSDIFTYAETLDSYPFLRNADRSKRILARMSALNMI